jgi:CHAT domain-containing protein/tetratricopeptide (TPR) repeat protein
VSLARLYRAQGRYAEAEPLCKRSLAITEKALGPDHPDVAQSLNNLALLYRAQGRYAEAEPLYKRALAIFEKALDPDHPFVGTSLNNLAALYENQGRYAEAELLYKRALAVYEKALGPDHPDVSTSLNNLAGLYFAQRDWARAADFWRRSTRVIISRAQRGTLSIGKALTGKQKTEAEQSGYRFWGLVKVAYRLASNQPSSDVKLRAELFQTAQWARSSEAAQSLRQMAARGTRGDPRLAVLVRERQDLVTEWQQRDAQRSAAVAQAPDKRNPQTEAGNMARLGTIDTRIAEIDERLAREFPDYAALVSPSPLSVEGVQAQLGHDEALVLILDTPEWKPTPEETFLWVVTKTEARWVRSEVGTQALRREVAALRCGLDYDGSWGVADTPCPELLKVTYAETDHLLGKPLPFNLARAHALYKVLFGEVEDLIRGKHLLIVPSDALNALPFQVLVTEKPTDALPSTNAGYPKVAWLGTRNALTVLPAVSSLRALRAGAKARRTADAYIGFGNPLLTGPNGADKRAWDHQHCQQPKPGKRTRVAKVGRAPALAALLKGRATNVASLRQQDPLPETADELCAVARALGTSDPDSAVNLGARATEARIKALSVDGTLARAGVVHFATHGLVAGETALFADNHAEPALLLTPPEMASDEDDGLLTASEVTALKLDAEWVILSACNTAAGDSVGGDALSGLTRAFFYAGARALLVSHWYVDSDATVALITKSFDALKTNPKIGRAEALRRAMSALIAGGGRAAHPSAWAPFVVVGEGGTGR